MFGVEDDNTLLDFGAGQEVTPVDSPKEIKQKALHANILSEEMVAPIVQQEYATTGVSDTFRETVAKASEKSTYAAEQALSNALLNVDTPEEAEEYLKAYEEVRNAGNNYHIQTIKKLAEGNPKVRDPNALAKTLEARSVLRNAANLDFEDSTVGSVTAEAASIFIIPSIASTPFFLDNQGDWSNYVLAGNFKVDFQEYKDSLPLQQRNELYRELTANILEFKENTGLDLIVSLEMLDILNPDYANSFQRDLDNVVSAVETIPFVGAFVSGVSKSLKVASKAKYILHQDTVKTDSMLSKVEVAKPESADDLFKAALNDEEISEVTTGVSATELYKSKMYANTVDLEETNDVTWLRDTILTAQEQQTKAFAQGSGIGGINLSTAEQAAQLSSAEKALTGVETAFVKKVITVPSEDGNGMIIKVTLGDDAKGFSSAEQAYRAGTESYSHLGVDGSNVEIFFKGQDGVYQKYVQGKTVPENTEFQARVNIYRDWDTKNLTPYSAKDSIGGEGAGYLASPIQRFANFITRSINVAENKAARNTKLLVDIVKPYTELGKKSKQKVTDLLEDGSDNGYRLSVRDLHEAVNGSGFTTATGKEIKLTPEEAKGVLSHYYFWDTVHLQNNRTMAKDLASKGYWKYSDSLENTFLGKPLEVFKTGVRAYNPKTDEVVELTAETSKKLEESGYKLMSLKDSFSKNDAIVKHLLVKQDKDTTFRTVTRNDKVLEYRKGYASRIYEGDYVVTRVRKIEGGADEVRSVAITSTKADALKAMEELNKGSTDGSVYSYRPTKEKLQAEGKSTYSELESSGLSGRVYQRHRGERLGSVEEGKVKKNFAKLDDPENVIIKSAYTSGNLALHYDTIVSMKSRLMSGFSRYFRGGQFPRTVDDISIPKEGGTTEDYNAAVSLFKYIQDQEGTVRKDLANRVWNSGLGALGDLAGVSTAGVTKDIIATLKAIPHKFFIQAAPLRQLALNSLQALPLSVLSNKYRANPVGLVSDTVYLKTLRGLSDSEKVKAVKKGRYKIAGDYSQEEWVKIAKHLEDSGLYEVISRHDNIDAGLPGIKSSELLEFLDKPFKLGSKYGMELGEELNKTSTFLIALDRYSKKFNVKVSSMTERDFSKIADDATKLALNMNRKDQFDYQQGAISIPLQYVNVFHKQAQMMLGGVNLLDKKERVKYAAALFSLYGASGLGLYNAAVALLPSELPEDVDEALKYGMATVAWNKLASSISGQEENANIANISAAQGTVQSGFDLLYDVVTLNTEGLLEKNAPLMGLLSKFSKNTQIMLKAATMNNDDLAPEDKAAVFVTSLGTMFGTLSTSTKAWLGASMIEGQYFAVDSRGNIIPEIQRGIVTHLLAGATGIESQNLDTWYNLKETKRGIDDKAKEIAAQYSVLLSSVYASANEKDFERGLKTLKAYDAVIKEMPPQYQTAIKSEFGRFLNSVNGKTTVYKMYDYNYMQDKKYADRLESYLKDSTDPASQDILQMIRSQK